VNLASVGRMDLAQEFHLAQKLLFKRGSLQNFVSEAERVDWEPVVRETETTWLETKP
jgi:hypothetical protein